MYQPRYHALTDIETINAQIDEHLLGVWVTAAGSVFNLLMQPYCAEKNCAAPIR